MDFGFDGLMKAVIIRLVFNLACNAKNPIEGGVSKEDSCGFFILLNDTIWTLKYYKYMYRIIQKMFFINILGLSRIFKKKFWQHPSIPYGSHSALPKMPDLSVVIYGSVRLKKHSEYGASFCENQKIYYKPPFLRFVSRNVNKAKES